MTFPPSLPIPDPVLAIVRRLEESGYETWCVGGAVRDALLGLEPPTERLDLATAATPDVVRRLFRRTVPVGIEHGTVGVLDQTGALHEVTTFRQDVRTDGRHAEVAFGVSIDQDLARRDFTINAMAYHPLRLEWRDPFDGRGDLARGVIRAVGDPAQRFREDYLRLVRALRFAARFGFAIEPATWAAARAAASGLGRLSAERVRDEWTRGLTSARRPSELAALWRDVGAMETWLPEVVPAVSGEARGSGIRDPGNVKRKFDALDALPRDPALITAYLSTDPAATLTRLRFSNAEIERARRIGAYRDRWPDPDNGVALRRWMAEVGSAIDDLLVIARVEGAEGALAAAVASIRASRAPLSLRDLAVSGEDLLAAGVPRGPAVGQVLRALLEEVLDDPARNTKDYLSSRIPLHAARCTLRAPKGNGPA